MPKTSRVAMPSSQVAAVRADVVRLFGDVDDEEISEVLALSPTISELAEASAWLLLPSPFPSPPAGARDLSRL